MILCLEYLRGPRSSGGNSSLHGSLGRPNSAFQPVTRVVLRAVALSGEGKESLVQLLNLAGGERKGHLTGVNGGAQNGEAGGGVLHLAMANAKA